MSLYIFILAFRAVCTVGALVYALKIARMNVTPTFPWVMFSLAFFLSGVQLLLVILNIQPVLNFIGTFSQPTVYFSQGVAGLISLFFFVAVTKTFYTLKAKFTGIINI